jgi:hypothetical protein
MYDVLGKLVGVIKDAIKFAPYPMGDARLETGPEEGTVFSTENPGTVGSVFE